MSDHCPRRGGLEWMLRKCPNCGMTYEARPDTVHCPTCLAAVPVVSLVSQEEIIVDGLERVLAASTPRQRSENAQNLDVFDSARERESEFRRMLVDLLQGKKLDQDVIRLFLDFALTMLTQGASDLGVDDPAGFVRGVVAKWFETHFPSD